MIPNKIISTHIITFFNGLFSIIFRLLKKLAPASLTKEICNNVYKNYTLNERTELLKHTVTYRQCTVYVFYTMCALHDSLFLFFVLYAQKKKYRHNFRRSFTHKCVTYICYSINLQN